MQSSSAQTLADMFPIQWHGCEGLIVCVMMSEPWADAVLGHGAPALQGVSDCAAPGDGRRRARKAQIAQRNLLIVLQCP